MFSKLPSEIKLYPQWICWRFDERMGGKPTKVPINPHSLKLASVDDPATWGTFDAAVRCFQEHPELLAGIGFVFSEGDPFAGIDLDEAKDAEAWELQKQIFDRFSSYTELSPSGKGVHIIIKAKLPNGKRFKGVEIYSALRFFTMTGARLEHAPSEIAERQFMAEQLHKEMTARTGGSVFKGNVYAGDAQARDDDQTIIQRAADAENGERFTALMHGEWRGQIDSRTGEPYHSQSEADLALVNMIAFYTQNRDQIARVFRMSGLGTRPKAKRTDYMGRMIDYAFDRLPPQIELDNLANQLAEQLALATKPPEPDNTLELAAAVIEQPVEIAHASEALAAANPYTFPPGLVGELAQFIFAASPRPVREISLAASLGFCAGLCGQAFNVSGTGLNLYLLVSAPTGRGKEAMSSGISRIVSIMSDPANPFSFAALNQFVGPGDFASGQALFKRVVAQPSMVSVFGEFGLTMARLAHPRATQPDLMLKRAYLDLYNKSGMGNELRPTAHSDKEKDVQPVRSPAFSILAETTPETFFGKLNSDLISDGLLPRFSIIEYTGPRVEPNKWHMAARLAPETCRTLHELAKWCIDATIGLQSDPVGPQGAATATKAERGKATVLQIPLDEAAQALHDEFDAFVDRQINTATRDVFAQLWNRATIKTLKIAALVSIGIDWQRPVISVDAYKWAKAIVVHETNMLLRRFELGEIGDREEKPEAAQLRAVSRVLDYYVSNTFDKQTGQRLDPRAHQYGMFKRGWLLPKVQRLAAFREDTRADFAKALDRTLAFLVEIGALSHVDTTAADYVEKFGSSRRGPKPEVYAVTDITALREQAL